MERITIPSVSSFVEQLNPTVPFLNGLATIASAVGTGLATKFMYPRFRAPAGEHKTIGHFYYRFPGSANAQVFYPANPKATSSSESKRALPRRTYFRHASFDHLREIAGFPAWVMAHVRAKQHPCVYHATPLRFPREEGDDNNGSEDWPVIIFSHGLIATMETNTQLCLDLASQGFVVIAPEHEDGSGSYSVSEDSSVNKYKPPPNMDDFVYNNKNTHEYRKPYLSQRVHEIDGIMAFLLQSDSERKIAIASMAAANNGDGDISDFAHALFDHVDTNRILMMGHSFGGATAVTAAHALSVKHANPFLFAGVVVHDVWSMPIDPTIIAEGVPVSVLSLLSEEFLHSQESTMTHRFFENLWAASDKVDSDPSVQHFHTYLKGTRHQSYSDTVLWAPHSAARLLGLTGWLEGTTGHRITLDVSLAFIRGLKAFQCAQSAPGGIGAGEDLCEGEEEGEDSGAALEVDGYDDDTINITFKSQTTVQSLEHAANHSAFVSLRR